MPIITQLNFSIFFTVYKQSYQVNRMSMKVDEFVCLQAYLAPRVHKIHPCNLAPSSGSNRLISW